MIAKQLFEDFSAKVSETLADSPVKDIGKNAKAVLGGAFEKMDLVTREEFETQQQILIKTRMKLGEMEARIAALEAASAAGEKPKRGRRQPEHAKGADNAQAEK